MPARIVYRWILAASVVALALWGAYYKINEPQLDLSREYRIGYGSFPPYFVVTKSGEGSGFSVDIMREATRRLNMKIRWVRYSPTIDAAFLSGAIDLFPMYAILPDRAAKFDISAPWWENTLVVISPADRPIRSVADSVGRRISLIHATFGLQRLKAQFPQAIPVPEKDYDRVVSDICTGISDGAVLEARLASGLSLLPQCKGIDTTQAWFPQLNLVYGVGARKGLMPVANLIHAEILKMAQDGTMTRIGEPWGIQVTNQKKLFDSMISGQVREVWLRDIAIGVAILLVVATFVSYRLRQSRLHAERALLERSQFVANISHEIRTPMNGLLGVTQILRDTPLTQRQTECVEILERTGQTLLNLIDELLDFSKIEARKIRLKDAPYSPATLVEDVRDLFGARAEAKGLTLTISIDPTVPGLLLGDVFRLRQVLSNLVNNAIKFTDRGRIDLLVLRNEDRICFDVVDTGIGIDASSLRTIFDPFTQADGSTSRQYGGTGLGLAICRDLLALMDGKISVQSTPGAGSQFRVELPLRPAPTFTPPTTPGEVPSSPQALNLRVLFAEDNAVNQQVMIRHLERLGCTWNMVRNGEELLNRLEESPDFDVVLMDGQMPLMDGFTATARLRARGISSNQLPVIGVTACAFEEDRQRCFAAGMQAVLTKPFSLAELRAVLTPYSTALANNDGQAIAGS